MRSEKSFFRSLLQGYFIVTVIARSGFIILNAYIQRAIEDLEKGKFITKKQRWRENGGGKEQPGISDHKMRHQGDSRHERWTRGWFTVNHAVK